MLFITKLLIQQNKGHNQKDVALKIFPNIKESTARQKLSQFNHGRKPSAKDFEALAIYFDMSVKQLLEVWMEK